MRINVTAKHDTGHLYGLPPNTWVLYYTATILGRQKDLLLAAQPWLTEREAREQCDGVAIEALNRAVARLHS